MVSNFRSAIEFFDKIGIYDVLLPFLLVFTVVFAILEKTKVFGQEKLSDGKEYTRKNINSMVAFVIAFMVVASAQLVEILTKVSSYMVILLMLSVLFLLLVGSFWKESPEGVFLPEPWNKVFMGIMFVGIVAIFLYALGWMQWVYAFVSGNWDTNVVSTIVLLIFVIGIMFYIIGDRNPTKKETK